MKRAPAASSQSKSGSFPSPVTPTYRLGSGHANYQKGWSSERVPLPLNGSRRYDAGAAASALPFGAGRALPSKWEDAEKWILSPVSGDGAAARLAAAPPPTIRHRLPKSKSGPLGPPGSIGMCSSSAAASPLVPCFDSGRVNFAANSPFMAGVLVADRGCCSNSSGERTRRGVGHGGVTGEFGGGGDGRRSYSANGDPYIVRSVSVHGWSDMLMESPPSLIRLQGQGLGGTNDVKTVPPPVVLKKDMATQMSPVGSAQSSPKDGPPLSPSLSPASAQLESHFSKLEIRDVQVDDQVTVLRLKKLSGRGSDKRSVNVPWKKRSESGASSWDVTETATSTSKLKREEAKITAWENLQNAKAEAAIRKLEMKLEKKRASSMDKILNKLKYAQCKAQQLRKAVVANQTKQTRTTKRTSQISSLGGCFACPAF